MLGGVVRAWRGEEGGRAGLRVSCSSAALGRLPGDSWLLGNSWPHWGLGVSSGAHRRLW